MERETNSLPFKVIVSILLVVIVTYVAVPSFMPPPNHGSSPKSTCIANMKQIDSAKEQWVIDNHKKPGDKVSFRDLVGTTLYIKAKPTCPTDGFYLVNRIGENPTCTNPEHKLPPSRP